MKKMTIAIDYDDVLALCTQYAVELEAKNGNILDYSSIDQWGMTGRATDVIFKYFTSEKFFKEQPLYEGAVDFISELIQRGHEVIILTAIDPRFASIRAEKIMKEFPQIKKGNIILSSRKDLVHVDVLVDDAPHNLNDTPAKFPICYRRPWNENLTGLISVFSYEEILSFIDRVSRLYNNETVYNNKVYCLVAPSCSGKTEIAQKLNLDPRFNIPKSTTTRTRRNGEAEDAYNFVSRAVFESMYKNGEFIETTVYAGNRYGTTKDEIDGILSSGKNAVLPIDFSGANALKMRYGEQCEMIYVKRPKADIIRSLLERMLAQNSDKSKDMTAVIKDIQNRILSIDDEKKNEDLCDKTLMNNAPIDEVIRNFWNYL
jgi:guanylate kinase